LKVSNIYNKNNFNMQFRTKLDYSDNRQIKQREQTFTNLSGGTVFGLPFSGLTSGVDISNTGTTEEYFNLTGNTFSGNNTTTTFNWVDSRMSVADTYLSAITPSNSATTQDSGIIFIPNTSTIIDGNTVYLSYSGVSLSDISVTSMNITGPSTYSGTVSVDFFDVLSGASVDYTGRTIWVDCTEIVRTKKLIITENPQPGYVWTCQDSEGLGAWVPSSGISADTNTFVTGATFNENTLNLTRNDAVVISATYTGNTNSSCISDFHVSNIHSCSPLNINPLDEGNVYIGSTSGFTFDVTNKRLGINTDTPNHTFEIFSNNNKSKLYYSDSSSTVQNVFLSGATDTLTQIGTVAPAFSGVTGGLMMGIVGTTASFPAYGSQGDTFIYSSVDTNNLNIITQVGSGGKHIKMYAGNDVNNSASLPQTTVDFLMLGSGANRGFLGIGLTGSTTPTEKFDVNGNARFRNIGSNASAGALHYDTNGVLTTSTSDIRMKSEITTISSALDKVLNLRGVTFKWNSDIENGVTGNTRVGFIAQEVKGVVPELTFTNERTVDKLMGVHYQDVTALLVEAIKELAISGTSLFNREEVIINSQTVASEDNNIELNYNGTKESAIGGGIFVNKGINENTNSEFLIDSNGNWVTNNHFKPFGLVIPEYTPTSSSDENGVVGEIVRDNDYIYIKRLSGWGRCPLENF
jgi:hypothetical protein